MLHAQTEKKSNHSLFTFRLQESSPYPPACSAHRCFHFSLRFRSNYLAVCKEKKRETFPYLGRIVVVLAELRLGSTLERVTSSVKSCLLVPCMWKNETRVHTRVKKTTPRLLLASNSSPRQCERAWRQRECGKPMCTPDWLQSEYGGVPEEVRVVKLTNDWEDDSYLGYLFCQPIHYRRERTR